MFKCRLFCKDKHAYDRFEDCESPCATAAWKDGPVGNACSKDDKSEIYLQGEKNILTSKDTEKIGLQPAIRTANPNSTVCTRKYLRASKTDLLTPGSPIVPGFQRLSESASYLVIVSQFLLVLGSGPV
jgi:hypothetical protein